MSSICDDSKSGNSISFSTLVKGEVYLSNLLSISVDCTITKRNFSKSLSLDDSSEKDLNKLQILL